MGLQASEGTITGVNGPGIPAGSFSRDTGALSVSLQGRRPQGWIYPEGQCMFLRAEPPPPCSLLGSLPQLLVGHGGHLELALAGGSRSRIVLGELERRHECEMHPEKTRHPQHIFTQRTHRKDNMLRHVHFHFLIKTKRRQSIKSWCHLQWLKIFGVSFLVTSIYSSSMPSSPPLEHLGELRAQNSVIERAMNFSMSFTQAFLLFSSICLFRDTCRRKEQVIDGKMPFCSLPL